jgi:hypothetical protein
MEVRERGFMREDRERDERGAGLGLGHNGIILHCVIFRTTGMSPCETHPYSNKVCVYGNLNFIQQVQMNVSGRIKWKSNDENYVFWEYSG